MAAEAEDNNRDLTMRKGCPVDHAQLLQGFHQAMLGIYDAARRLKAPYTPVDFRRMVVEMGGKGAADKLLASSNPSEGYGTLPLRGKDALKLSVEYVVLQNPWRALFEPEQLAVARQRLIDVKCDLPPEDTAPAQPVPPPVKVEPQQGGRFVEGASQELTVTVYERNPEARARCIEQYGTACVVRGFSFGAAFGTEAEGFIHVHHLKPLAEIGERYEVDPIADLRPVCPNCPAFIHLGGKCRPIDEVQRLRVAAGR